MIKNVKNISLGNGYLFLGINEAALPTTEDILGKLRGGGIETLENYSGCMKGDAEISVTREVLDFETGIPQEVQLQAVTKEGATFKCSLAELSAADLKKQLGGGLTSSVAAGVTATTMEATMTGVAAQYLGHILLVSPTPVVTSQDATPVTYVVTTDYVIDSTFGTITRVSSGAITDGEVVNVAYSYTSTGVEHFTLGGQASIANYFLRFVHFTADERLVVFDMYKAGPSGNLVLPYKEKDWGIRDIEFKALADTSKPLGKHLFDWYEEVAT